MKEHLVGAYRYKSGQVEDTARLADWLGQLTQPGMVIAMDGQLGAGKTTFSQAFAKAIGVTDLVNSPTFTIIKEYKGRLYPFYHMDVYRISLEDAEDLGLDDYFYGDGVTVVEWASQIKELLPEERLDIYMERTGENERIFHLMPFGEKYKDWCETMKRSGDFE